MSHRLPQEDPCNSKGNVKKYELKTFGEHLIGTSVHCEGLALKWFSCA